MSIKKDYSLKIIEISYEKGILDKQIEILENTAVTQNLYLLEIDLRGGRKNDNK